MSVYSLGHEELVFLAWSLGYPSLYGLSSVPLADAPANVRALILGAAEHSLRARGWLWGDQGGKVKIEPELERILRFCCEPEWVIALAHHAVSRPNWLSFIYLCQGNLVEYNLPEPGVHYLMCLEDEADILDKLQGQLWGEVPDSIVNDATVIADSVLLAARNAATEKWSESAQMVLSNAGVTPNVIVPLAESLATVQSNTSMTAFGPAIHHNRVQLGELSFLEGTNCLWMLESIQDDPGIFRVRVTPVSASQAYVRIGEWLAAALG